MKTFSLLLSAQLLALLLAKSAIAQGPSREHRVDVVAADFALILRDTITAGTHRWTFLNTGKIRHELIIAKLARGFDANAAVDTLHARGLRAFFPGSPDFAVANSALFAAPSERAEAELVTEDRSGDVLLVFCQLRDGEGKPKHDELGMFKIVHVR